MSFWHGDGSFIVVIIVYSSNQGNESEVAQQSCQCIKEWPLEEQAFEVG